MRFINSEKELLQYLPNVFSTVAGERNYFERLAPWIESAEKEMEWRFLGTATADALKAGENDPDVSQLYAMASRLTASAALLAALPSLDLVMTANGFGIVQTENIAPASAERVRGLTESLTEERDKTADALMEEIRSHSTLGPLWEDSATGRRWRSTLFLRRDELLSLLPPEPDKESRHPRGWCQHLEALRPKIEDAESMIAERWISGPVMRVLRGVAAEKADPLEVAKMRRAVLDIVSRTVKEGHAPQHLLERVTNHLRMHPELWPEWESSATARLFEIPAFRNRRDSGGYFF